MTEYLSDFVQESKESITELNNALLDLERNPDDGEAMDQVFRTAHTLKGNAGAMGFDDASDLAHAIEDLLDAIRAGSLEISPELMDDVFDGVDALETMVEEVGRSGEPQTDPTDRIESLRTWIEESTGLTKPTDGEMEETLKGITRSGRRQHDVYHARLSITEDGEGGTVVDALRDAFDLLSTDPAESAIRSGDHPGIVDVAFGSAVDEAAIAAALDPVDAVEDAIITQVPDPMVEEAVEESATAPSDDGDGSIPDDVDPEDMSVDNLLDQFNEYDDLDEAVERVDEIAGLEMDDLGQAGAFADVVEDDVEPAYEETEAGAEAEAEAEAEAAEAAPDEKEEVEDAAAEFEELQDEYDQVGLDQMEEELEGVEFGEFDEEDEVGFDELLDEEDLVEEPAEPEPEPEPAEAEAEPAEPEPATVTVEAPGDDEIESALAAASAPEHHHEDVFHARIGIVAGDGTNNGQRVAEALRDAFDLLGTQPSEDEISVEGEGDHVDAVFAAEVDEPEIQSALDSVEVVDDAAITGVTDRVEIPEPEPEPEPAEAEAEAGADAAADEVDEEVIEAEGEIEDAHSEFQQMQQAYDQVGLDEMESELEDVEFGEYDQEDEVGFDELLGDEVLEEEEPAEAEAEPAEAEAEAEPAEAEAEPAEAEAEAEPAEAEAEPAEAEAEAEPAEAEAEPAEAEAEPVRPTVEAPDDDLIDTAVDRATAPEDRDNDVFHVRLGIIEDADVNNGQRVVEALRDAFDLLSTHPPEDEVSLGEYEHHVDAVFASHVDEGEIQSALDPVEEVSDVAITEVTDRVEFPEPEPEPKPEPEPEPAEAEAEAGAEPAEAEASAEADPEVIEAEGEIEDAHSEFQQMQSEFDQVGLDEIESELEEVEFGEFDEDDEVGFDELLGDELEEVPGEGEAEPADVEADAEPAGADAAEAADTADTAEAGFGDAETDDFETAEAGFGDAETDDFETADTAEAGFGDAEADDFETADTAEAGDFGDVEVGDSEFGDTETAPDEAFSSPEEGLGGTAEGTAEDVEDVEVEEISVEDDALDAEVPIEDPEEATVTESEDFGDVEVGGGDDFGDVEVGGDDFGDVEVGEGEFGEPAQLPEEATADVDTIKGIGSGYADRLADADVETVGDLVQADPETLAAETDISDSRITEWVDRAPVDPADLEAEPAEAEPAGAQAEAAAQEEEEEAEEEEAPEPEREMDRVQTIRVDIDRVDELLNMVEGLVTTRARLRRAVQGEVDKDTIEDEIDELEVISQEMQDNVVDMRLVPVESVTQRLPRVVRDIARDQGKRVRFDVEGEDVEIDRSILNRIGDPLIHMVRNAVDHGIEPPEEREAAGKDEEGHVELRVHRERDDAVIEVEDDGRGLDPDALREKAVEEGIMHEDAARALDDEDTYELIFESGFSTTEEVTDVSGRGVGMDVVASTVEELDGEIEVESEPGEGTTIRMVLPVSVAISEVAFLESGDEEYGVPIKMVDEISGMAPAERVETEEGTMVRMPDGTEKELIELHEALDVPSPAVADGGGMLVTIEDDVRSVAIHCDNVRGQEEVVVKPFEGILSGIPGLGGAAVLGEGEVVNIVDIETL